MKDIYELIRQKENDLERIEKELDALRIAARLLDDAKDQNVRAAAATVSTSYSPAPTPRPQPTATPTAAATPWASAKQFP
jgi:hypothetical protein